MEYQFISHTNRRNEVPSFYVATDNVARESAYNITFEPTTIQMFIQIAPHYSIFVRANLDYPCILPKNYPLILYFLSIYINIVTRFNKNNLLFIYFLSIYLFLLLLYYIY
jgi:hypothetical protein